MMAVGPSSGGPPGRPFSAQPNLQQPPHHRSSNRGGPQYNVIQQPQGVSHDAARPSSAVTDMKSSQQQPQDGLSYFRQQVQTYENNRRIGQNAAGSNVGGSHNRRSDMQREQDERRRRNFQEHQFDSNAYNYGDNHETIEMLTPIYDDDEENSLVYNHPDEVPGARDGNHQPFRQFEQKNFRNTNLRPFSGTSSATSGEDNTESVQYLNIAEHGNSSHFGSNSRPMSASRGGAHGSRPMSAANRPMSASHRPMSAQVRPMSAQVRNAGPTSGGWYANQMMANNNNMNNAGARRNYTNENAASTSAKVQIPFINGGGGSPDIDEFNRANQPFPQRNHQPTSPEYHPARVYDHNQQQFYEEQQAGGNGNDKAQNQNFNLLQVPKKKQVKNLNQEFMYEGGTSAASGGKAGPGSRDSIKANTGHSGYSRRDIPSIGDYTSTEYGSRDQRGGPQNYNQQRQSQNQMQGLHSNNPVLMHATNSTKLLYETARRERDKDGNLGEADVESEGKNTVATYGGMTRSSVDTYGQSKHGRDNVPKNNLEYAGIAVIKHEICFLSFSQCVPRKFCK